MGTVQAAPLSQIPLGQTLLTKGIISQDQLNIALTEQKRFKQPLGKVLVTLGFVTEATIRDILSETLGQVSIDLENTIVDPMAIALVPKDMARRYHVLPVSYDAERKLLLIAVSDPANVVALDQIRALAREDLRIEQVLARESDITIGIEHHYGFELSIDGILNEIETGEIDYQSLAAEFDEYSQPVVRLVDALLHDAVKRGASDIHFEPEQGFLRIRYRIDGVLRQIRSLHKNYWAAMVVRLKVMSGMNIAETRAPQDGRISLTLSGHQVDFRVSAQPTTHGENIVLRILDRDKGIVPLEELGLHSEDLKTLKLMLARPEGIILVTGPTGSGKTTTLYAALSHINDVDRKIITIEDPIEYHLGGINQIQVSTKSGLTFARGLRAILRHDPDVILIGEIRDHETAEIAVQASLTGHLVFSTLHTNDAPSAVTRLIDMGIEPYLVASSLELVLAQRLVRLICPACKMEIPDGDAWRERASTDDELPPVLYHGTGCRQCQGTGYRGRRGIFEMMPVTEEIRTLILERASAGEVRRIAAKQGMLSLRDDGMRLVRAGLTTIEEVLRVAKDDSLSGALRQAAPSGASGKEGA